MKILLTTSPREGETILNTNPKYVLNDIIKYPPLALLAIVRNIKAEHEVIICDANEITLDALINKVVNEKPDILGISTVTDRLYGVIELAKAVKEHSPKTSIVVGGPHVDLFPQETMYHTVFDFMLCGPCELSFPAFIEWFGNKENLSISDISNLYYREGNGGIKKTDRKVFTNIDDFPFPDRKRIDIRKYTSLSDRRIMTTMNSSRGCPFRCEFCNVPRYYMNRCAERIVEEIEEILTLGFNEIHILDDTFNINRKRVIDICSLIVKKNLKFHWSTRARLSPFDDEIALAMKEAGCFRVNVGVESHNNDILKFIKKGITVNDIINGFEVIHKNKLESLAYFIVGFPDQSLEDAMSTIDFVKIINPTFILMNTLLPVPFSNFYFGLLKNGTYKKDYWNEFVLNPTKNFMLPSWRGERLDHAFNDIRDKIMKEFYLAPSFVLREAYNDIKNLRFKQLGRKIDIGLKMMLNSVDS